MTTSETSLALEQQRVIVAARRKGKAVEDQRRHRLLKALELVQENEALKRPGKERTRRIQWVKT